jgi:hypothetical protein
MAVSPVRLSRASIFIINDRLCRPGNRAAAPITAKAIRNTGAKACTVSECCQSPRASAVTARDSPHPGQGTPVTERTRHCHPATPNAVNPHCIAAAAEIIVVLTRLSIKGARMGLRSRLFAFRAFKLNEPANSVVAKARSPLLQIRIKLPYFVSRRVEVAAILYGLSLGC